jgi:hypothetical protein
MTKKKVVELAKSYAANVKEQAVNPYWFRRLLEQFEKEFGHVTCRELTECDFTTEAGRKKYAEQKLWETRCRKYIESATAMVFDLISEKSSQT